MMKRQVNIADVFSKHLFWDVDMSLLDIEKDRDLIIPRALYTTSTETFPSDIVKLEALYSKATILRELKTTREKISNNICRLIARRYHAKTFLRWHK